MKKQFGDYCIGLDVGTESVGWAATDDDYRLLRFNGKPMWGVHLFDAGKTAQERRVYRITRRRGERRLQRLLLLQELFAEKISEVDPGFYLRLKESKYWADDKTVDQPNTLFHDEQYADCDYHRDYPTVYHLRKALIDDAEKKHDIRLLYLAVAHILKNRGHFLLQGQDFDASAAFPEIYASFQKALGEETELDFSVNDDDLDRIKTVLKMKINRTGKKKELQQILRVAKNEKRKNEFLSLLVGNSAKLAVL